MSLASSESTASRSTGSWPLTKDSDPEYRYIPGYEGYCISKGGRVYSHRGHRQWWKPVTPSVSKSRFLKGDLVVSLFVGPRGNYKIKQVMVAELVALAWIGPKPKDHCIAFKDKDRTNVYVENLCWMPILVAKGYYKRLGEEAGYAKLTTQQVTAMRREVAEQAATGVRPNFDEIGSRYGCCGMNVLILAQRKSWKHVEDGIPAYVAGPSNKGRGSVKLNVDQVRRIKTRLARGETVEQIHPTYAHLVGIIAIKFIASGKTWTQVQI